MNEEAGDRILQRLLEDVSRLERLRSALIRRAYVPGSVAESDSRRPLGDHVPSQCLAALGVAIDHLEAWADLWINGRQHPLFAHITLVRGAIEGAVRCLWILDPDASQMERVARAAGTHLDDLVELEKAERALAREAAGESPPATWPRGRGRPASERIAELREELRRHGVDARQSSITQLVARYGSGELTYRLLSGVAHGKDWAVLLARRDQLVMDPDLNVVRMQVSGDPMWSAQMTGEAVRLLQQALGELSVYFGSDPPSWPAPPAID